MATKPHTRFRLERICNACGVNFVLTVKPQKKEWGLYCSKSCAAKAVIKKNNNVDVQCKTCGKVVTRKRCSPGKYCSHKCRPAWNKGLNKEMEPRLNKMGFQPGYLSPLKKHTAESIAKMRQLHKGKILTVEHRLKLSKSHIGQISTRRGVTPCKEECKRLKEIGLRGVMTQQKRNPTSIEIKVYNELVRRGLLFEKQKLINGNFLVDAYIPAFNLVIEADGDYWHSLEATRKRDKAKNAYLSACGFGLLRLSETEINNGTFITTMGEKIGD
jgi:very-short-patch-repair endonuclease